MKQSNNFWHFRKRFFFKMAEEVQEVVDSTIVENKLKKFSNRKGGKSKVKSTEILKETKTTFSSSNGNSSFDGTYAASKIVKETRKPVTKEDMQRYNNYAGQKWMGVCKWFNVSKGFGFLIPDNEEAKAHKDEVFVHQVKIIKQ